MQTSVKQTQSIQDRIIKELEAAPESSGRRYWQTWEDNVLRKFYSCRSYKLIAEKLNRTVDSIQNRAYALGLKKENT